jgi:colanic acid biosynthesis glycosyl transferase WcaI
MNILLVCAFFPPEVGSAAHLFFELGQALKDRGHRVTVLTGLPRYHVLGDQEHYRRRPVVVEDYHGLQVCRVINLNIPWNVPLLRGLDQFFSALSFGLAGLFLPPFDLALVYSPPLPLALSTYFLSRLRGKPAILNVQDIFPQSAIDLGVLRNPFLIRLFNGMEAFLYQHFPQVVVHSEGNRQYVISRGGAPERVTAVPNWVDTEALRPGKKDNHFRDELGWSDRFVVSFAGIMGYSQDLETVIQASALLKDHPKIAILLVGDGVEKPGLQKLVDEKHLENVTFLPMQPKEEYLNVLHASDLCLVTLRKEVKTPVVPSKILSIMAAGRPVLASLPLDGDAPRLIKEAQAGTVLPPGQPELMAQAILKFSQDGDLGEQMGASGRHYAVQHLSLQSCVARLERLFQQVTN